MKLQFKLHPFIIAVWVLVICGVGFFVYKKTISWEIGAAFLVMLGLPSLLGSKGEDDAPK